MLIDERLYLPQKWIDDKVKFRTKYELGLEMIDNAEEVQELAN